jgi:ABC-type uncharacterized transport system fused permease/ATPase subunit
MFPRDMVCLRNISVDTLHKGYTEMMMVVMMMMMMIIIIIITIIIIIVLGKEL